MGLLSYFGIKFKPKPIKLKPKNEKVEKEIQALNEAHKKLMDEIQTDDGDFFDADKFVCGREVFDLIRKLPNFSMADPRVPESGYYNGKPIYVHPACEPNTFMGIKTPKEPSGELVYSSPIDLKVDPEALTDFYGRMIPKPYVVPNYNKVQVHTKPNTRLGLKIAAGLMLGITVSLIVGVLVLAMIAMITI